MESQVGFAVCLTNWFALSLILLRIFSEFPYYKSPTVPSSYSKISSILILVHFNLICILIYLNAVMGNGKTESNVLLEGRRG